MTSCCRPTKYPSCQDTDMYSYMTADDACEEEQCSDTVDEHTLPQRDLQVHGDVMACDRGGVLSTER